MATKKGSIRWTIYELFYNADGLSNTQKRSKGIKDFYFSEALKGATLKAHIEATYDGETILNTVETKKVADSGKYERDCLYVSTGSLPIGSIASIWVEVEGHPEYGTSYQVGPNDKPFVQQCYVGSTGQKGYTYVISSAETNNHKKLNLHSVKRTPSKPTVTVQGTLVPYRPRITDFTLDRHFLPGTVISFKAEATGYITKEWTVVMPDEDYTPENIVLKRK